jgi:glycerophosphoryl diester phosphodiesterase
LNWDEPRNTTLAQQQHCQSQARPVLDAPCDPGAESVQPLIIGHRGASALAPENTLVSIERALEDGADGVEFDVRLARDGVAVVIHDKNLKRTGLKDIKVERTLSHELVSADVGTWYNLRHPKRARAEYSGETLPTLADVLSLLRRSASLAYVELKVQGGNDRELAQEVIREIRRHEMARCVVVESFSLDSISEIKKIDPELRTAALFDRRLTKPAPSVRRLIEQTLRVGAAEMALHHSLIRRRTVDAATGHGIKTVAWTVDKPVWISRALKYELHGLITNDPGAMRSRLDARLHS